MEKLKVSVPGLNVPTVTLSNALTRAGHSLTLGEKRLVMLAASKIGGKGGAVQTPVTRVTAAEYADTFGVDMNTAYEQLQNAGETLFKRYITFYQPANRRKGKAVADTRVTMHWVGRASYQQGEGWIELAWWHEVLPHLFGLKQQFTRYRLELATRLRSIYSWKILELLSQFEDKQTGAGWRQMTLEDLEESLELPPSMRGLFGQLKRKALDPAVKELADKEGFLITYKTIKTGRRVTAVKFTFQRDRQGRLF